MSVLTETPRPGEFIISEANGSLSRETVVIASGQNLSACAVLGKVTASGKYKELNPAASDGTQIAAGVLVAAANATAGDIAAAAVVRLAEVNKERMVWKSGATSGEQATALTQLASAYVIAR